MTKLSIQEIIRDEAYALGFVAVGFASPDAALGERVHFDRWLEEGFAGEMDFLLRADLDRLDPRSFHAPCKTVLSLAIPYARLRTGDVANYALGEDYHRSLRRLLQTLGDTLVKKISLPNDFRICIDSAPLHERPFAEKSGVAFIGKHSLAIVPSFGSDVFLAELLLSIELPQSVPAQRRCGECTRCLDICPTQAFVSAYVLDAKKCISYLTIEFKGTIPQELRPKMGTWIFGCDLCQNTCPFNASKKERVIPTQFEAREHIQNMDLIDWLQLSSSEYKRVVKNSAMRRTSRKQLHRNAAIALGNRRDPKDIPTLKNALLNSIYPLVRAHLAWALAQFSEHPLAYEALRSAGENEKNESVLKEISAGMSRFNPSVFEPSTNDLPRVATPASGQIEEA